MSDDSKETEKPPSFSVRDKRRVSLDEMDSTETSEAAASEGPEESKEETSAKEDESKGAGRTSGPSAEEMKSAEDMAEAAGCQHRQAPEVDFTTFIISLASSAMVHLAQAPHPDAEKSEVNLPMAKQVVDMLAMLKEKTKGNLEPEEERYIDAILYDLRLRFVEATKTQKTSA